MGSAHLSGMASLSRIYLIALSKWPLPFFAAVSKAEGALPFGEAVEWYASRVGRSVEDELKVCENHPESRVGRSLIRDVEDVDEYSWDGESGAEAAGRSERVRGLGINRVLGI